jgi:hypothetical protein
LKSFTTTVLSFLLIPFASAQVNPAIAASGSITPPVLSNEGQQTISIIRSGSQPSAKGPVEYFTGTVRIDSPFQGKDPARIGGAIVNFEPGARTA